MTCRRQRRAKGCRRAPVGCGSAACAPLALKALLVSYVDREPRGSEKREDAVFEEESVRKPPKIRIFCYEFFFPTGFNGYWTATSLDWLGNAQER